MDGVATTQASHEGSAHDLPHVLRPIAGDLGRVREAYLNIVADVSEEAAAMVKRAAVFSGKRLRPALTCLAARAVGGDVDDDVARVAAIVELIHTATLVHDDILDAADLRRERPTLNAKWGEQAAVLVGDVLFSKAYRTASYLEDRFASRHLADAVGEVLEGEILQDVLAAEVDDTTHHDLTAAEAQYRRIIRGKTAALYDAALQVGAHYGGADASTREALGRYGHHLGMAFQIVDDRLDLSGEEAQVGKSLGRDISEGKLTLPMILWLREQGGPDREEAAQIARPGARRLRGNQGLPRGDSIQWRTGGYGRSRPQRVRASEKGPGGAGPRNRLGGCKRHGARERLPTPR